MSSSKPSGPEIFTASSIDYESKAQIPSMLSIDEKALYYNISRTRYSGSGLVIELGPWLGSGTFEICRGLTETGKPWLLTVMDRFTWNDFYTAHYKQDGLSAGDSFLPKFLEYLQPYQGRLIPISGDLSDIRSLMPFQSNIELLFVDAPKSWRMLWRVLDHVGPWLLPNAQLVFQDFFHITSRQLIWLLMSLPQIEIRTIVEKGTSAVFEAKEPIVDLESSAPQDFKKLTPSDFRRLWGRLQTELPPPRVAELAVGMALDLMDRDAHQDANDVLVEGVLQTPFEKTIVNEVRRLLRKADKEKPKLERILDFLTERRPLEPAAGRAVDAR